MNNSDLIHLLHTCARDENAIEVFCNTILSLPLARAKEFVETLVDDELALFFLATRHESVSTSKQSQIYSSFMSKTVARKLLDGILAELEGPAVPISSRESEASLERRDRERRRDRAILKSFRELLNKDIVKPELAAYVIAYLRECSEFDINYADSQERICTSLSSIIETSSTPDELERVVSFWSAIMPEFAKRKLRQIFSESTNANARENAKRALIFLGGDEATFAMLENRQQSFQKYKNLLEEVHQESMKQWRNTERRAQTAFWTVVLLNISTFVVGVVLIGVGLYLIVTSNNPTQTISGAILSAVATFATSISRVFIRGPLGLITRSPADQGITQGAFMSFMDDISEIRLAFEDQYTKGQVSLDDLQRFQEMRAIAGDRLSKRLRQSQESATAITDSGQR